MSGARPDIAEIREQMRGDNPRTELMSPQRQNGSLYVAIMAKARHDAGIDYGDPPELEQHWFSDEELLVIDLGGSHGD